MIRLLRLLLLILLLGGLLGVCLGGRPGPIDPSIVGNPAMLISRVVELSELVTLRVPVSTVITTELAGYTGSARCIIVVNGEVELGVDLEQARFENIDTQARTATLVLPEPKTRAARLDHTRTQVYSLDRQGLWVLLPSDEPGRRVVNRGMKEAYVCVEIAARDRRLVEQARARAEQVLRDAFHVIGWDVKMAPAE